MTATNAAGNSEAGSYTRRAAVVSGRILRPTAPGAVVTAVANDQVSIYALDAPASDPTTYNPVLLGTVTTNSSGNWSYRVPAYASLPAAAQVLADNNGGILNTIAIGTATATPTSGPTAGIAYLEQATGFSYAWVGSGTPGDPLTEQPDSQTMTLVPQGPDDSGNVTSANLAATWSAQHDYTVTANNDDIYCTPVTDAYGYQEIGINGTYNPYMAADGTDLTGVAAIPFADDPCTYTVAAKGNKWDQWINIGEAHAYYDAHATGTVTKGGAFVIQVGASADAGGGWGIEGTISSEANWNWTDGLGNIGTKQAQLVQVHEWFRRYTGTLTCLHSGTTKGDFIVPKGVDNPAGSAGATRWSGNLIGHDGPDYYAQVKRSNPSYLNYIPRGHSRCVGHGRTLSYSVAFKGPGFSVSLSTIYSKDVTDCISAGMHTAHLHWEWGFGGSYTSKNAHVLYSY